ncbi:glutathione S-transferase [Corallincola platygyrae]|uniref:Glutathione S-transferase n=1 Tax=Corallincola platygyrae TaxID=1193278 RepID=A0ABW4XK00_9GAMM
MKLVVGTESTWSLRVWLCLQIAELSADETVIDLAAPDYKQQLSPLSPTCQVPVLYDGDTAIHDSLAIAEYLNEKSGGKLLPDDPTNRAIARSLCAELHAGFQQLRGTCPFHLGKPKTVELTPALSHELARLEAIFAGANGPFMFEKPSMVDAFYALMAYRLASYGLHLTGNAGDYQRSLISWPLMQQATTHASDWQNV